MCIRDSADAGIVFCPASGRPAPKLEEMFEGIKNRLAFCPDNGACVIYRGSYIYKSNIDVELYQQVLSRASEDPRAVPVLCCFDEFYVLARDHQYHDEISEMCIRDSRTRCRPRYRACSRPSRQSARACHRTAR